ncbi:hypothetical protein MW887_003572 [Aspergillus wentii]|nr:hypothetical protein MW887_003572 [Aspergillus wentii]
MHFLCLHGVGTNSKVLEMQTAALRYELGDGHTYDFVEGMFPYELAPEIKDFVSEGDQGFSYFDPNSTDASLRAVSDLQRLIVEDGPYDGILAFSQGMMLASTLLVHLQRQKAAGEIAAFPFKCAVFFSPRLGPLDYKELEAGKFVEVDGDAIPEFLSIPTTLIWGSADPCAPKAVDMQKMFQADLLSTYVHGGGHEVPGVGDKEAVTQTVNRIRRTVDIAA